jgi:hypothetical protein
VVDPGEATGVEGFHGLVCVCGGGGESEAEREAEA